MSSWIRALLALVRTREERGLMHDTVTDPLTGAFNQRHFQTALRVTSGRLERASEPASLIVLDVDHFKAVNETFGHTTGDVVLKTLVTIVARRIRAMDVMYRIGGDEFALLLSNASLGYAVAVAEDLRSIVGRVLRLDGWRVSISGGVSELKPGQSTDGWLADAAAALCRAKREGRNRIASESLVGSASAIRRGLSPAGDADGSCESLAATPCGRSRRR